MGWVTREKQALVETLRTADPDADTLCAGWDVRRLLAHLVQREQGPIASISDAIARKPAGQEPGLTRLATAAGTPHGYQHLVGRFAAGPPKWSPMSWAAEKINLVEYVIHHEDIRRGGPDPAEPRRLPAGESDAVWAQLGVFAKLSLRTAPGGVTLRTPTGASRTVKKGVGVTLTGEPVDLALYVSGRRQAARVEVTGADGAVAAFTAQT